ncbi:hypothetical protein F4803DRAFT_524596 [Xylaria telfairii]|nr:hypothetical protein F4803DRAFT_524596 [Xylaria telfairii]
MQRLATSPITSMPDGSRAPPGMDERDPHTLNIWIRNKIKSWARKLIFLPATPEVAILADMVSQLRREAEAVLGQRVKGVAIASPDCVRLARYEIGDILDYLWMEDLVAEKTKTMFDQLFSLAAASAGYGDGLCPSYMDAYECEREEQDFLELWTLQLDFGHQSLSGALDRTSKARHLWAHDDFVDLELGASYRPHEGSALEQEYWNRVRTRIRDFVESKHRSERLYLTGDSASEPRFLEVVKTALMDIVSPSVLEALDYTLSMTSSEHYLFATSKGAAEFAKRRQEGMALCQLPEECRGRTYHRTPTESKEL